MMEWTYQQVINEADERYSNALSPESKLRKLNKIEKELFRTIYRKKTATVYDVVTGNYLYPLDFHVSKVIHAIYNGKRLTYEEIVNDQVDPPFLYTYENSIGIMPTPETDIPRGLFIFHYVEPTMPADVTKTVQFDPDFTMILVYGLCIDMAEIDGDTEMVNNFTAKYNGLLDDFKKAQPEPELPPVRVE